MATTREGSFPLIVRKLKKHEGEDDKTEDVVLELAGDTSLQRIWEELEELGYAPPDWITLNGTTWRKNSLQRVFHPFKEVEVVSDKAAVDEKHVHIDEPLYACSNRRQEVKFEILHGDNGSYAERHMNSLGIDDDLTVIFHRTIRMPDDERLHALPASVGSFPLYNVADYADKLPDDILEKGGVFFPMWQREALWIEFQTTSTSPYWGNHGKTYAIRVYIGQINAVTGINMMEERARTSWVQDYIVVPGQRWIDGVCVAPGVVRQFVAMPLGSGYTVEGQKSGQERYGGLQLEIIPAYQKNLAKWLAVTEREALRNAYLYLDEAKTPAELGLKTGAKIRSYPPEATYQRPAVFSDLTAPETSRLSAEAVYYTVSDVDYGGMHRLTHWSARSYGAAPRGLNMRSTTAPPKSNSASLVGAAVPRSAELTGTDSIAEEVYLTGPNSIAEQDYLTWGLSPMAKSRDDLSKPRSGGIKGTTRRGKKVFEREAEPAVSTQPLSVKAMGVAAGGKLIQDIVSDSGPPSMWNVDAARVVNLHIFDPVSCESVTHIVPPPIPMSAYQAVEANMTFFLVEEQVDNRVEGGDFDNVKSVSQMDKKKGIAAEPSFDPTHPTMCKRCEKRLCDCIVRPCDHQFCNVCIRVLEKDTHEPNMSDTRCPRCHENITRVAGFSTPMNLPGEESVRTKMPVHILTVNDGRVKFQSIRQTRI